MIEDRAEVNGKLSEVTRDYYAVDRKTGGVNGAKFGLIMPAKPVAGDCFQQELAPKNKAVDRSEVIALNKKVSTPAL